MKRIDAVYALITDATNSRILMVQNSDSGRWSLPGGKVEPNETFEVAAIREAKEETGLDIELFGVLAVNEFVIEKNNEHIVYLTFKAGIMDGQMEISRPDEITQIAWIDCAEADKRMPYYKEGLSELARKNIQITYFYEGRF